MHRLSLPLGIAVLTFILGVSLALYWYTHLRASGVGGAPSQQDVVAWSIELDTSGGMSGHGNGGVVITSHGEVSADRPRWPPELYCRAEERLPAAEWRRLDRMILSSEPEQWGVQYSYPEASCNDISGYRLELRLGLRGGGSRVYAARWDDCAAHLLPDDLAAIQEVAMKAKGTAIEGCKRR